MARQKEAFGCSQPVFLGPCIWTLLPRPRNITYASRLLFRKQIIQQQLLRSPAGFSEATPPLKIPAGLSNQILGRMPVQTIASLRPFKTQFPAIICTKDLVERAVFYKYFVEGKQIRVACYKSNRSCYKFESGLLQIRHELLQIRMVCYKSDTNCYKFEWFATNPTRIATNSSGLLQIQDELLQIRVACYKSNRSWYKRSHPICRRSLSDVLFSQNVNSICPKEFVQAFPPKGRVPISQAGFHLHRRGG